MSGELILASSSAVRKELLERSNISFASVRPNIDEDTVKSSLLVENYSPRDIADALAELKKKGLKFYSVDVAPFQAKVGSVYRKNAAKVGGMDVIELVSKQ